MKHLKIYFAVLFFSFLGAANAELMAQGKNYFAAGSQNIPNFDGDYSQEIQSSNKLFSFEVTSSGMKIINNTSKATVWSVEFPNSSVTSLNVTDYGYFKLQSGNDKVLWKSGTQTEFMHCILRIEDDGNLAFYRNDKTLPIWATGTCGGVLGGCGPVGAR
jgi:hypothetical protein